MQLLTRCVSAAGQAGHTMPSPEPVFARLEGEFVTEVAPAKVAAAAP